MILLKDLTQTLQLTTVSGLSAPTRKGYVHAVGASLAVTLTPGGSIANGDWMIIIISTYDSVTPTTPTGWTVLQAKTVTGTQCTTIYGKLREAGDSSYVVGLNLGSAATDGTLFWGSGSDSVSNWVIGATKSRASISPTTTVDTVAPSITTTTDHTLVLSFSTERLTADESDIVSIVGAQKWAFFPQNDAIDIQTTVVGVVRDVSPAGVTSDVRFTYPNAHPTNGQAIQIGIPAAKTASIDCSATFVDVDAAGTLLLSTYEAKTQPRVGSTIFSDEVPISQNEPTDTAGVELGLSFTAFVGGAVTAIRYYKGVGASTASKDGHLWDDSGTLLASITFINETASGWQTQYLSSPVTLTGGLNYTVSYYTPNGNYANTTNYFGSVNKYAGPLAIDFAAGAGRTGNGIFKYSATSGAFPNATFNQTNYFVDVVFVTDLQTTTTMILPQPVGTHQAELKQLSLVNVGILPNKVAAFKWQAGSDYMLCPGVILLAGEMLEYDDKSGWRLYASDGTIKENFAAQDTARGSIGFRDNAAISGSDDFMWAADKDTITITGSHNPVLQLGAVAATPPTPASGRLSLFGQRVGGKVQLMKLGPSGDDEALQASLWQNSMTSWTPSTNVGTWIGASGNNIGTAVQVSPSSANVYTQMRRSTFASTAGVNTQAGLRSQTMCVMGLDPGIGGFMFVCRFGFDTITTGTRAFVGMAQSTSLTSNEPSSMINACGFGFDSSDNAWSFIHNDGVGVATKEPISGQGTLATNNTGYDAYVWSPSGSKTVYYRLDRIDTGATLVEGSTTADIPTSNIFLLAAAHCGNGTNTAAGSIVMGVNRLYVETNR